MKKDELIRKLESLESPEIELPAYRQRLKQALLNAGDMQRSKGTRFWSPLIGIGGLMFMKSRALKLAAVLVPLFIMLFAFQAMSVSAQPAAYLTLQVNPSLQLALDKDNRVIGIKALNNDGETIIASIDVQNKTLEQAIQEITDAIIAGGYVKTDAEILIALHPAPGASTGPLPGIADFARSLVMDRLAKDNLQAEVKSIVVSNELYCKAGDEGIYPKSYVRLVEANVSTDTISALLNLKNEPGISQEAFDEEFEDVAEAFVGMVKAGISEQTAIAMLKEVLKADADLDEIDEIASALIELKKKGLSESDALAKITEALAANPKLDDLSDTLGISGDDEENDDKDEQDESISEQKEDQDRDADDGDVSEDERADKEDAHENSEIKRSDDDRDDDADEGESDHDQESDEAGAGQGSDESRDD